MAYIENTLYWKLVLLQLFFIIKSLLPSLVVCNKYASHNMRMHKAQIAYGWWPMIAMNTGGLLSPLQSYHVSFFIYEFDSYTQKKYHHLVRSKAKL